MAHFFVDHAHKLCDYRTGQPIRAATPSEISASLAAAEHDGGVGAFNADEVTEVIPDMDAHVRELDAAHRGSGK